MKGELPGGVLHCECPVGRICCDGILQRQATWITDIQDPGYRGVFKTADRTVCGNREGRACTADNGVNDFVGIVTLCTRAVIGRGREVVGLPRREGGYRPMDTAVDRIRQTDIQYVGVGPGSCTIIYFVPGKIWFTVGQPGEISLSGRLWLDNGIFNGMVDFGRIVTFQPVAVIGRGREVVGFSCSKIIDCCLNSAIGRVGKADVNHICVITGRNSVINFVTS